MPQTQQPTTGNRQAKLKVCGLCLLEQINSLIALKIDFLGFIFYEKSPRFVLNHLSLRELKNVSHPKKIGVFVNKPVQEVAQITREAGLWAVQLHTDEPPEYIGELKKLLPQKTKIIKVFRVEDMVAFDFKAFSLADFFLFDTNTKAFGGSGNTFNWELLNDAKIQKPYFLSGGISLENIKNSAALRPKPYAFDINSKFELSAGVKNLKAVEEFQLQIANYESEDE